nr:ribonuclease H-like domain-containing protein [Tanacetum cinerariifolium]
ETGKGPASETSTRKKGRTVAITTEDMQKRRNDVKARTPLLLALPDEHQLRFSKYETAKELWEAILKTFGGNEATKKTKKNQLKLQYGNFKAKGSETLEAPRSQDRGKRENYKQGPKVEEPAPKALMAIDGIGWDWSHMANEEENYALVADDEVQTEVLERDVEIRDNKIEYLKNELEQ